MAGRDISIGLKWGKNQVAVGIGTDISERDEVFAEAPVR